MSLWSSAGPFAVALALLAGVGPLFERIVRDRLRAYARNALVAGDRSLFLDESALESLVAWTADLYQLLPSTIVTTASALALVEGDDRNLLSIYRWTALTTGVIAVLGTLHLVATPSPRHSRRRIGPYGWVTIILMIVNVAGLILALVVT